MASSLQLASAHGSIGDKSPISRRDLAEDNLLRLRN
jgi:hypothetical protein